ncbi:c-type cytochrome [Aureispira sp. CCB-QB1]|uniref:c-type cytochrome n=1 Tax=Aureispira sp. CCB-QB1 TaxID=1313421 RepID=UPI0006989163|nr:c-type cytochrome [Aureispira sp. CCB-QB1]
MQILKSFCLIIFSLSYLCTCSIENPPEEKEEIFSLDNLPTSNFKIQGNKDTILKSENGIKLYIPFNSFLDENGQIYKGEININIVEILSTADLVLSGINTITSNGRILENKGAFKISINETNVMINPDVKIKAILPQEKYNNSQVFIGEIDTNNQFYWKESHHFEKDSINYWLIKGKEFLHTECASCHNVDLVSDMTGPALAWVSKRWDNMSDLIAFTQNSFLLAEAGNLRAKTMLDWSASAMTNCSLSEREIKAIYDYIDEECIIQGIDSTIFGKKTSTETYQTYLNRPDSMLNDEYKIMIITNKSLVGVKGFYGYFDYLNIENANLIEYSVRVDNEEFIGKTRVKLILPKIDLALTGIYDSTKKHYTFFRNTTKIELPIGEKGYLLAVSRLSKVPSVSLKEIQIRNQQEEKLILKKSSSQEIIQLIKNTL